MVKDVVTYMKNNTLAGQIGAQSETTDQTTAQVLGPAIPLVDLRGERRARKGRRKIEEQRRRAKSESTGFFVDKTGVAFSLRGGLVRTKMGTHVGVAGIESSTVGAELTRA